MSSQMPSDRHPRHKDRRTLPKRRAGCRLIAVALNDVLTAAIINRAETVAHATFVKLADTWVYVITDAI